MCAVVPTVHIVTPGKASSHLALVPNLKWTSAARFISCLYINADKRVA
jgi:hypothetical protein